MIANTKKIITVGRWELDLKVKSKTLQSYISDRFAEVIERKTPNKSRTLVWLFFSTVVFRTHLPTQTLWISMLKPLPSSERERDLGKAQSRCKLDGTVDLEKPQEMNNSSILENFRHFFLIIDHLLSF